MDHEITRDEVLRLASDAIEGLGIAQHWWRTVGTEKEPSDISARRLAELNVQEQFAKDILRRLSNG